MGDIFLDGRWMVRSLAEASWMGSGWAMEERILSQELQMRQGWEGDALGLLDGRFIFTGFYFSSALKGKSSVHLRQRTS